MSHLCSVLKPHYMSNLNHFTIITAINILPFISISTATYKVFVLPQSYQMNQQHHLVATIRQSGIKILSFSNLFLKTSYTFSRVWLFNFYTNAVTVVENINLFTPCRCSEYLCPSQNRFFCDYSL